MALPSGFKRDPQNNRLDIKFDGTTVIDFDANDISVEQPTTFSAAVTATSTVDLSGATLTNPTRLAFHDIESTFVGADGAVLALSETAGDFFRDIGSNQWLIRGEATINETEASVGFCTFTLPENYVAGGTVTFRAVADIVLAGDAVLTSATLDCEAYKQTDATGAISSDLCATDAIAVTTTGAAKNFTITPTGLVPGDKFIFKVTSTVIEEASGTGAAHMLITKVGVECQVNK